MDAFSSAAPLFFQTCLCIRVCKRMRPHTHIPPKKLTPPHPNPPKKINPPPHTGYMVGPILGAALFSLGGFRLPFLVLGLCPLAVCLVLPPLLREAHNFDPNHQLPGGEKNEGGGCHGGGVSPPVLLPP